jgi:hypothetical protein
MKLDRDGSIAEFYWLALQVQADGQEVNTQATAPSNVMVWLARSIADNPAHHL